MVEASHEKEQRAKETIHNLKIEISNQSGICDRGGGGGAWYGSKNDSFCVIFRKVREIWKCLQMIAAAD